MERTPDGQVSNANPILSRYRFIGSGAAKTATVALFDRSGIIVTTKTLTIGTTAAQINDNTAAILGAGVKFDDNWVGMMVYGIPASTIYALPSSNTTDPATGTLSAGAPSLVPSTPGIEVSSSAPSVALTIGMWFGVVPDWVKNALSSTSANQTSEITALQLIQNASDGLNYLYNGVSYPVLHAFLDTSAAGDTAIIAAHASKKNFVIGFHIVVGATANSIRFRDGTTSLTALMAFPVNSGINKDIGKVLFGNAAINTAINLNLSGATAVGCDVWYIQV